LRIGEMMNSGLVKMMVCNDAARYICGSASAVASFRIEE
jgi:hypothetical protein